MTDNEYKNWAFLSYSPQDNREQRTDTTAAGHRCWGNWLHDALKSFSIPAEFVGQINGRGEIIPERIEPIFRDESELADESNLSAEVRTDLEQSRCLIVVCSPRSAQSRQVNEAVRYFKQLGRGQQILPIVIAGEPNASAGNPTDNPRECFVPALRHPVSPDGTIDTARQAGKSIFVDARQGFEKREILANDQRSAEADLEMAKIQLIALLLAVGFNGLWWREQKRHFIDFAEARQQAREALNQTEETRRQLQSAQEQVRVAQNQALEKQNLPGEIQSQIQAAQNQAQEAQQQAREAQKQVQEFQNKVRDTQAQLEAARDRALAAEGKILEAQQQVRSAQTQLEEIRHQAREAQSTENQSEEIRRQAQVAEEKFLAAQRQVQELQDEVRSAENQLAEAGQQVRAAQDEVREIQNQTRDAQGQIKEAQNQVRKIQSQSRTARRLTQIFAVLAVLALLAAGQAWRQRKVASQVLAKATAEAAGNFNLAAGEMKPVRLALQKIGGAEQAENRQRSLDQLAAGIPSAEIPEALSAAAVIVDDRQRSHFQKWLLVRLGWSNPMAAMTNASAIAGKIVNDEGMDDSVSYFQLAVLDNWMQTDWPGAFNWVCQLPDTNARQRALEKIICRVQSQPDSETKNTALATCINELAKMNLPRALTLAESLPEGTWRSTVMAGLLNGVPPAIMQPRAAIWPWTKFLRNSNLGRLAIFPVETEMLSTATNDPVKIQLPE